MPHNQSALDYVTTTYVVHQGKVLLIFHKKLQLWLPPGGHINKEETPDDCAIREVWEETGLVIKLIETEQALFSQHDGRIYPLKRPIAIQIEDIEANHQHVDLIYVGIASSFELSLEKNEIEKAHWFKPHELDRGNVTANVRTHGKLALHLVADYEEQNRRPLE
jgi:8-oxo-dGTP pyrophosphatase MutT (NUDIX family)